MLRTNRVDDAITSGRTAVNAWVTMESTYVAEILSYAGFDAVTIDAQHGMFGRDAIMAMLQAVSAGQASPFVRSPSQDPREIGWLLDAGAYGMIIPDVATREQAEIVSRACFYPPAGTRSLGPTRGTLYAGATYYQDADKVIQVWPQIESKEGYDNMEDIMSTPGLYGVFVGPNDLALSMGLKAGGTMPQQIVDMVHTILERSHAHGLKMAIYCADADEARYWAAEGADLVNPSSDSGLLLTGGREQVAHILGDKAPDRTGEPKAY
ncbi:4-hydroxy-2-oxoheptanedioate aldolase [Raineyella antarctica]|uniref:4-hydroxy-2-oxoheptanedioate aldolase n=1 Tax=Raineyella antarctica TaxID=1577474 RepID=A0A1G6GDY6_9ACTN|nr:aldolase/citrate lyase family protein [Raineyella antarctica]SDB80190.1 4-hydroxy-2-oxoheptanedioate aldolase [Raineyella antarctica]